MKVYTRTMETNKTILDKKIDKLQKKLEIVREKIYDLTVSVPRGLCEKAIEKLEKKARVIKDELKYLNARKSEAV